jgi:hypothetical protein
MQQKNVKTINGSSIIFVLSNHSTFSQTQADATVTFNEENQKGFYWWTPTG